jgi:lipopolysaccharide/colanic/teichoic acid biosynthesis glycosyltransferase
MLLIALVVGASSRGPVLFKQERVGHDRRRTRRARAKPGRRVLNGGGRSFWMYKFRTMDHCPPGAASTEVWASAGDTRITRIGSILRRHRLDELPQLFNVLRGDMNVVGPRPEQPALFRQLSLEVDGYLRRQAVRPGITGWAQINQSYDRSVDDVRSKVLLDLEYISRRSAAEDLRIMARTVPVMIWRKGAH